MRDLRIGVAGILGTRAEVMNALAVAAVLRLGLMIAAFLITGTGVMTQGDTSSYIEPGRNLLLHGLFANGGMPEIDRTPGYPIFAMLSGMFFSNVLLTVFVQILVSLGSLLLVSRIADRTFPNSQAGAMAAWLFAFEPASIVYCVRLMPETLFVFLMLAAIERVLVFQATGRLAVLPVAAVALVAATYVRPVSYYLVPVFVLGLVLTGLNNRSIRWRAALIMLAIALPCLAAWQLRNRIETGYSGFSSIVEKNLYFFQSAEVTAELRHISLGARQRELGYLDDASYLAAHPEQVTWGQADRLRFMRAESEKILAQHPKIYLGSHLSGVAVVALTPCASEWLQLLGEYPEDSMMPRRLIDEGIFGSAERVIQRHPGTAVVMALLEAILLMFYALAIVSLASVRRAKPALWTLTGIALYFLLVAGGAQAVGRYRLPVMPELCVLAAGGIIATRQRLERGRKDLACRGVRVRS